jgi:hypothetical protein
MALREKRSNRTPVVFAIATLPERSANVVPPPYGKLRNAMTGFWSDPINPPELGVGGLLYSTKP